MSPAAAAVKKFRLLLDTLQPAAYVPVDISAEFLYESALRLGREFPWLSIRAICADFADQWHTRTALPAGRRVIFYPGSTIGNMEPAIAEAFLADLRRWIGDDGGVLVGVDLHKSEQLLNAAYNDAQGVTAEFNLNILNAMNTLIDADFQRQDFSHRAFYNQALKRIEMHLVSNDSQTVSINGSAIEFTEGETLHTENSYKYTPESFNALSVAAGFTLEKSWLDEDRAVQCSLPECYQRLSPRSVIPAYWAALGRCSLPALSAVPQIANYPPWVGNPLLIWSTVIRYWSRTRVHARDIQTNRITRLAQFAEIDGGYRMQAQTRLFTIST